MAATRTETRRMAERRLSVVERLHLRDQDPVLLACAVALIAFSVFTLAMATTGDVPGDPLHFVVRQSAYGVIGLMAMFAIARIDYSRLRELRVGLYAMMMAAIAFVLVFGAAARGSQRRIELPYFGFQPSEFAKVILVIAFAAFVLERIRRGSDRRQTVRLLALGLAPASLVFLQPDLGTAVVLGVIVVSVLFIAGLKWSHLAAIGATAVLAVGLVFVAAPSAGLPVVADYQQERFTSFLNPSNDPSDAGYQVNQALIAVGSGGRTGRGDEATQAELEFLPERHTDFIFAVIGERFGFLGASFVLSLYALLVWRGLRITTLSKSFYGTLIAGGITAMLMFQVFVNVGVNLGIMPVTGVTLPLLSYGGSSVLATCLAIGVLQSVHIRSRQLHSRRRAGPQLS